jgi:hypothetical protein
MWQAFGGVFIKIPYNWLSDDLQNGLRYKALQPKRLFSVFLKLGTPRIF